MAHATPPNRNDAAVEPERASRPTMKDVAARADVSVMTVSNVINARAGTVGKDTERRVRRAMEELRYYPNLSARALRSDRSDTLAFLLRDESEEYLADPLTNLILAGIGDVLRERERSLLIQTVRAEGSKDHLLLPVLQNRVDGAFVLVSGEQDLRRWYIERLQQIGRPFVVFDEVLADPSILSVRAADRDAGRMITEHLQAKGHERIAFIGARVPWAVVEQRRLGYADALRAKGVEPTDDLQLFEAGWQPAGGAAMTKKLLQRPDPPTAIVCGSDVLAIGATQAVQELGLSVPGDVAVTGFDDFEFSAWVSPSVTTVKVPAYEMGRIGATMLLDVIEGKPLDVRQVVLPVSLVTRESA